MSLVARLEELGYSWRVVPHRNSTIPILSAKRVGNLVFVSGQVPTEGDMLITGRVGDDVDAAGASYAAGLCALNCVYAAATAVHSPDDILGVVNLLVFVCCVPGFTGAPNVANGATELLTKLFGEDCGMHARAAIGGAELPMGAVVEITAVFEVR